MPDKHVRALENCPLKDSENVSVHVWALFQVLWEEVKLSEQREAAARQVAQQRKRRDWTRREVARHIELTRKRRRASLVGSMKSLSDGLRIISNRTEESLPLRVGDKGLAIAGCGRFDAVVYADIPSTTQKVDRGLHGA